MADILAMGKDLHEETARKVLGSKNPSSNERDIGKTLNFSIIYGGGIPTIQRQLKLGYGEARNLLDSYHKEWPGIRTLQRRINFHIERRGYLTTLYGRRLRPKSLHAAPNALIQGSAADIIKVALVKTHKYLENKASHIVLIIHDELGLDASEDEYKELAYRVPELMIDQKVNSTVPMQVDVEWSTKTWADKEAWCYTQST